jgi:hypothetical protein
VFPIHYRTDRVAFPLATVIDDFPVLDIAGLAGSTLWGLWIVATGVVLVARPEAQVKEVASASPTALT